MRASHTPRFRGMMKMPLLDMDQRKSHLLPGQKVVEKSVFLNPESPRMAASATKYNNVSIVVHPETPFARVSEQVFEVAFSKQKGLLRSLPLWRWTSRSI